ncbi:GntR family transcriptional regulator [Paracoccus suum]|uniref:GntR family transcriptional regulator n=1 Tax=Paracoccus suum TaxID=2259340 RepID=A0A344PGC2_9RHOB|nr:GntR family transcriptional regulator [Paracoccus suum]AXC48427.1 GntR family transcriptional regulator [Paracoccus suum]
MREATAARARILGPIEQIPLRLQIADKLRNAIVSGELRPGTVLVETALAEELNVSRAPIREAIQILEADGLVETAAYKGKWVKPLSPREVTETYQMREVFEVMAVRLILESGADLGLLWEACDRMTAAAVAEDRPSLIAADESFHRTLIGLAEHQLLARSWNDIYLRIHQIMALRNDRRVPLSDIAANHPPIVRAMEDRDDELAVRLISEHTRKLATLDPAAVAAWSE